MESCGLSNLLEVLYGSCQEALLSAVCREMYATESEKTVLVLAVQEQRSMD